MTSEEFNAKITEVRQALQKIDVTLANLECDTEDSDEIENLQSARDHICDASDALLHMPFSAEA